MNRISFHNIAQCFQCPIFFQFTGLNLLKLLFYFICHASTPLSGDDIWIKVLPQKRYIMHIDECDIWNDLRPFLNFLVHPFSSKLRSKEAKELKSGNLGKRNFFLNINFSLIFHNCFYMQYVLKVDLFIPKGTAEMDFFPLRVCTPC